MASTQAQSNRSGAGLDIRLATKAEVPPSASETSGCNRWRLLLTESERAETRMVLLESEQVPAAPEGRGLEQVGSARVAFLPLRAGQGRDAAGRGLEAA